MTEIAITGMGAVAATGIGTDALWAACRDGIDAIGPLELKRPCKLRVNRAAQVRDFDPLAYLDKSHLIDRLVETVAAAQAALDEDPIARSGTGPEGSTALVTATSGA